MFCWNALDFKCVIFRKVTGAGHNFVRRAIMELNESPAMQNIEVSLYYSSVRKLFLVYKTILIVGNS